MRTTITFDADVAQAITQLQHEEHVGVSAAVNSLVRRGLIASREREPFVQRTSEGNARLDLTDVSDVIDLLDGPAAR